MDLNQRPHPYQGCALTTWATGPCPSNCLIIISSHFLPVNKKFTFFSKPASCDETVLLQRNKARSKCLFRWIRKSVDLPARSFLNGKPHSRFLLPPVSLHASLSRSLCTNTCCIVFYKAGVRQLKIHKSSKSGLVVAFFVSSPWIFLLYVCCTAL